MGRKPRFPGAGGLAETEFNRARRKNVQDAWLAWLGISLLAIGLAVWSGYSAGIAARVLAGASGALGGILLALWALGGHVSAFAWLLGTEGERMTGKEIEKLGADWHCEHAIKHEHGDWDHVLIGPAGVFLVDSKFTHGNAVATRDSLRIGKVVHEGGRFRGNALDVHRALERHLSRRAPFVHPAVAVWGAFPQERHDEGGVAYVAGEKLTSWLAEFPAKLHAPDRAALVVALKEVRAELSASPSSAGIKPRWGRARAAAASPSR